MTLHSGAAMAHRTVRAGIGLTAFVLGLFTVLLPPPARAAVQLTSFSVTNPPPPESQPSTGKASRGTAALTGGDLPAHDATVGTLAGTAGTQGGAATYSVPIVVPPGRAGMQPSLSLTYNSRGGNGVAGLGWSISGLSSIHRCPQTLEQDGIATGVSYSANDRLCLDGQRLVAVSGSYGAAGTVYATEVDSHARITQIGGGLTGTATCFKVEQKDGRILHYGAVVSGSSCATSTANSRVQAAGAAATLSWLVEKIEDRVGNNQLYAYTNYGNGEVLPVTVTYTGFGASAGNRAVTFGYQPRTNIAGVNDVSSSYLAGGLTMQTQALASITTAIAGTTARTLTPGYVASQYNGRLLMATLTECASNNGTSACHPATQFTYNDDVLNTPGNFPTVSLQEFGFTPNTAATNVPYQFDVIGDLDGDGTKETLVTVNQSDGNHVYLAQMTADRQIHVGDDITNYGFGTLHGPSSDIDGSGRAAMIKLPAVGTTANLQFGIWNGARGDIASGNPFQTVSSNIPFDNSLVRYGQNQNIYAADLDNDGKADLLIVEADSSCGGNDAQGPQLGLFYYRNTTSGQLSATNTTATFVKQATHLFCLARTTVHRAGLPDTYYAPTIDHVADFDGDGLPDIYMVYSGNEPTITGSFAGIERTSVSNANTSNEIVSSALLPAASVLNCDASSVTSTTDECNWQNGYFAHWIDVNGDGLEDFVIARPYQKQWQIRLNKGGTLAPAVAASAPAYAGLDAYPTQTTSGQLHGSGYLFRYLNRLPVMDADADGKPEILIPQSNSNTSPGDVHGFALKMCLAQERTLSACPPASISSTTSSTATSAESSSSFQCLIYICSPDPGGDVNLPDNADYVPPSGGTSEEKTAKHIWNGLPAYNAYGFGPQNSPPDGGDNSVYHLAALKFTQSPTGAFTATVVNTPIVSRLSAGYYNRSEDLFGDGLADVTTAVGCPSATVTASNGGTQQTIPFCAVIGTASGTAYGPTTFPGVSDISTFASTWNLYGSINQGVAQPGGSLRAAMTPMAIKASANGISLNLPTQLVLPGLLDAVVDGVGDTAVWGYAPLSASGTQDGIALYTIDSSYVDSRHYLFQSSMPVVNGMGQSSGNGQLLTGFRASVYGYGNAMYNRYGRGFTGFQTIIAETGDGTDASGQHFRATRTTTTYNQKFPLTGTIAHITTSARDVTAAAMTTVRDETDNYVCTSNRGACPDDIAIPAAPTTGGTVFAPVLDSQSVKTYDLGTGAQYAQTDTVNANGSASGWDAYGNLTYQTVTRADKGANVFVDSHTTTTSNTFTVDRTNWWLDKLTQSSVTSSVTYDATHALPAGASAPSQTLTTGYTWNTDRTPATKTVQAGITNQQSTTTYCYPGSASPCPVITGTSYGLPSSVSVNAPDLVAALSPTRTTSYTYTKDGSNAAADGYFVLTAKNALNQTATTTHATNDGQVLTATDPNGVQVVTSYDAFGRAIEVDRLGNTGIAMASATQTALTSCLDANRNPGHCPKTDAASFAEDGNEANAAYRVTTVQAGYPTQVAWFDLLGRTIKSGHRGFDGTFIANLTDYDDMGTAADTSTPYFIGNTPFLIGLTYDALNRPTKKIAPGSEMDPTHGDVQTDYTYAGNTTALTVHGTNVIPNANGTCKSSNGNLCLQMSRSQNVLGQWMQTTQSPILNGATQTLTTNYWTEPLGHIAAMRDAEGNITTAGYNALGQRTQSADPDQGTWNFSFDALGELLTQTDARGVITTVNSRDALGRTTQRQQVPPSSAPAGLAYETVLDDWTFDPVNGIGKLKQVQRRRAAGRTVPAQSATPVWQESYGYEAATARPSTITTTVNESGNVVLNSGMSY
ncbi:MAG: hypothetical protein JSS33_06275, partial [Proteobacteria bacterium]|nr:hypothetical protein [Pseudomonadota bacterium]